MNPAVLLPLSAAVILYILLVKRPGNKSISPPEKLALFFAVIGSVYGILSAFLGQIPATFAQPIAVITGIGIAGVGLWICWIPLSIFARGTQFKAEIICKPESYKPGEYVRFKMYYLGKLRSGFFDCEIAPPSGTTFPHSVGDGGTTWSWDPDTLDNGYVRTPGKLDGYIRRTGRWHWQIPVDYPIGEYTIYMRVYNHFEAYVRPIVEEMKVTIQVTKR